MALRVTRQYTEVAYNAPHIVNREIKVVGDLGYIMAPATFITSQLKFGKYTADYKGWLRVQNVPISQGSEIKRAYIWHVGPSNQTNNIDVTVYGNNVNNAVAPVDYADYATKGKTAASVNWSLPNWTISEGYKSPELKTIIQEIVDRPGWVLNNDLMLLIENNGSVANRTINDEYIWLVIEWVPNYNITATTIIAFAVFCQSSLVTKEGLSVITFAIEADSSIKCSSAESSITFTGTANAGGVWPPIFVENSITFAITASAEFVTLNYSAENEVDFYSIADYWIDGQWFYGRILESEIEFGVTATYTNTVKAAIALSEIIFDSTTTCSGDIQIEAETEFTYDYTWFDDNGDPYTLSFGLAVEADYQHISNPSFFSELRFEHEVLLKHIKTGGPDRDATSNIVFAVEAVTTNYSEHIESEMTFTVEATTENSQSFNSEITFNQTVLIEILGNLSLTSEVTFNQATSYEVVDKAGLLCDYSVFVGTTTDEDAPAPPETTAPTIITGNGVTLSYPVIAPTDTIILRDPEYNNKDQISFQRINRVSRGGTLIIYADPRWTKTQLMSLEFIGLTEAECQNVLDFTAVSLGKEIRIEDWEGRIWIGIITNPENPISRVKKSGNMLSYDFEINRLLEKNIASIITFSHEALAVNN